MLPKGVNNTRLTLQFEPNVLEILNNSSLIKAQEINDKAPRDVFSIQKEMVKGVGVSSRPSQRRVKCNEKN
mgnify:CR=1 FL=1